MFLKEAAVFLISSLITLALTFFKIPINTTFQIIIGIIFITLVLLNKFLSLSAKSSFGNWLYLIKLLISSLLVQLIIVSTGAFYSPLLVLLYLYTIAVSFLINTKSSAFFIGFSAVTLTLAIFLNPSLKSLFYEDIWLVAVYLFSFVAIMPLISLINRTYNLKDSISKILSETLAIGKRREQSILQGLNELVLVTDTNFKILSFNEVVEKTLNLEGKVTGEHILSVLKLKNQAGNPATLESLSLDQVLTNRVTYVVKEFELETKDAKNLKVLIQIKPIINTEGKINQIAFVLIDARTTGLKDHSSLDQARLRQKNMMESIKTVLDQAHFPSAETTVLLLGKLDEDLLIAQDLEDHPFKQENSLQDLVELCQQIIVKKYPLSQALQVSIKLTLSKDEVKEAAYLSLKKTNVPAGVLTASDFSVSTDFKWAAILLEKLIDIAMLLLSGQLHAVMDISFSTEDQAILVSITSSPVQLKEEDTQKLLEQYNFNWGSGLEGYIAKTISQQLNIPITISLEADHLSLNLKFQKGANP